MKSIVLDDEGGFTQVQFQYFSVHDVPSQFQKTERERKKVTFSKFFRKKKVLYI